MAEGALVANRVLQVQDPSNHLDTVDRPRQMLIRATEAAKQLKSVVEQTKSYKEISGKKHLFIEAWQTIGSFFGATSGIDWVHEIKNQDGKVIGYEARAFVTRNGVMLSAAEARCARDEANWANRDLYAIKSMAQTRACSKALRLVFSWVAVLGGYQPTPAEEISEGKGFANEASGDDGPPNKLEEIGRMLLEMNDNDKTKASEHLYAITSFKGKDGKDVPGVKSLRDLRGPRLRVTFFKIQEAYNAWRETAADRQPGEDDAVSV